MHGGKDRLKARACARIEEARAELVGLSARIHAQPELKFEEIGASTWLADYLTGAGFAVERGAYGLPTAFAARLGSGRPRVTILCEYDALPAVGHACGHNIIAAAGAGAVVGLAEVARETGGSVIALGTPAEEGGGGKIIMARAGAFDDVDAAMMIHPAGMDLTAMSVLAVSQVEAEYHGRPSHAAAAPHRGINALDGLVTAYNAIAQLRQHIESTERLHGIITDGGQAPNVVPERAAGLFFIRAASAARLAQLKERVHGCFRAGAAASGAELRLCPIGEDYSDFRTNEPLAEAYAANAARLGRTVRSPGPGSAQITGSTDMGNVSKLVPAIHPMLAVSPPEVALHTREFAQWAVSDTGHQGVVDGAKTLAMTAADVLCDPELLAEMKAAFAADAAVQGV